MKWLLVIHTYFSFYIGKYRLEPVEAEVPLVAAERNLQSHLSMSPPQSPKRSASPTATAAAVATASAASSSTSSEGPDNTGVGTFRLLLTKAGTMAVDANRLVKHLTESGVTGAQVISDAAIIKGFLANHRRTFGHRKVISNLLPDGSSTSKNAALIVIVSLLNRLRPVFTIASKLTLHYN